MFTEITLGKQYSWKDQVVEPAGYVSSYVVGARLTATGKYVEIPTSEIQPLHQSDSRKESLDAISEDDWQEAKRLYGILSPTLDRERLSAGEIAGLASLCGLSERQVRRLRLRLRDSPLLTTLVRKSGGRQQGSRNLLSETEKVISHVLRKHYLIKEHPSVKDALERIEAICRRVGCPAPSRNAVVRRIQALDPREAALLREGPKAARQRFGSKPGSLTVDGPLHLIQIDHTPVDLVVVANDAYREPLMRPWLTVALDVYSRCVLGFYLALHAPSALSVGMCIAHAMLPKEPWLADLGLSGVSWPMYGKPTKILTDNATEFRGTAMARGCERHGIILEHRPVGRPHWGGHVERLIGTLMGRVHLLPGTTFSNTQQRGKEYDSEARACLTLSETQEWLTYEICNRYHVTRHKGIGMTPAQAWEAGFSSAAKH